MRTLGFLSVGAAVALLLLVGLVGVHGASHLGIRRVPGLGNFDSTVRALPREEDGSFRFAVLGDPEEAPAVFRDLMKQAFREGAAFVLIAGDVVDRPTREAFEFLNYQYRALGPAALPTFAAAGNHDLSPKGLFQEHYGPEHFHFIHGGSLFILVENNRAERYAACARYVREVIEQHRGKVQHIFIVLHVPIIDFRRAGGPLQRYREQSGYLYEILDSEKVDAVLAGHFHGYLRETYRNTLILVTGGAGGRLHDPAAAFHMVLIDVTPEGIRDRVVLAEEANSLWDWLSYRLVIRWFPLIFSSPLWPLTLILAAVVLLILGIRWSRAGPHCPAPRTPPHPRPGAPPPRLGPRLLRLPGKAADRPQAGGSGPSALLGLLVQEEASSAILSWTTGCELARPAVHR